MPLGYAENGTVEILQAITTHIRLYSKPRKLLHDTIRRFAASECWDEESFQWSPRLELCTAALNQSFSGMCWLLAVTV